MSREGGIGSSHACVADALRLLGVRHLTLCIHDASFPGDEDEDPGRGTPYSRGGLRFVRFLHALGFTGLQLGPQGETPPDDPSPYRGVALPKSVLSIALAPLAEDPAWGGVLPPEALRAVVRGRPRDGRCRVAYDAARRAIALALQAVEAGLEADGAALRGLREERRVFEAENADWLERYALFQRLHETHGTTAFPSWAGVDARLFAPRPEERAACAARLRALAGEHAAANARFRLGQFVVHRQQARLRALAAELGLRLFADLPIGLAPDDEWCQPGIFLEDHRMGAPPSRTNPDGQPWGYPLLDPAQYRDGDLPGPALRAFRARVERVFAVYDGVRIDHPHGLVDPWVYDSRGTDPFRAVQQGARLFSSPDLAEHPELARFAIARTGQLRSDGQTPRHADDWVAELEPEQVRRYGILIDEVLEAARAHGRDETDVACEVLSTLPYPLERVLAARGLGRFRVTQKRDPDDPRDPYRSDLAAAEDWIMVGTHDTPPLWRVLEDWRREGRMRARAAYLAIRLAPDPAQRSALCEAFGRSPEALALAELADLFVGPARQVMVFFADLLGETEVYNAPGSVLASNWTLRVPPDWPALYRQRLGQGRALNLPAALALALRARGAALGPERAALLARLDAESVALRAGALPGIP